MGHKLNSQLLRWLREHSVATRRCSSDNETQAYRKTCWRLRDRLTERDIIRLIMAFRTGMATKALAESYGINVKSVRKLMRENGVQRESWFGVKSQSAACVDYR